MQKIFHLERLLSIFRLLIYTKLRHRMRPKKPKIHSSRFYANKARFNLPKLENEEQRAVFVLCILEKQKFSSDQIMDAMRFINKWCVHYSFNQLITELTLLMDNGQKFLNLILQQNEKST